MISINISIDDKFDLIESLSRSITANKQYASYEATNSSMSKYYTKRADTFFKLRNLIADSTS